MGKFVLFCLLFSSQFFFSGYTSKQQISPGYTTLAHPIFFKLFGDTLSVNEWTCPKCGYDNPYWNTCCTYCGEINW